MPLLKKIKLQEGVLGIRELTDPSSVLLPRYQLSAAEKTAFEKLKLEKRRKEFLAVRLIVQDLISEKKEIVYEKTGRPQLKDSPFFISISHSSELAAVLLSEKTAGIDVENIHRNIAPVARRFLTEEELRQIAPGEKAARTQITYWSAKEAIFKCSCIPNIQFNQHIQIHPFNLEKEGKFRATLQSGGTKSRFSLSYFFFKNNVIVCCVEV